MDDYGIDYNLYDLLEKISNETKDNNLNYLLTLIEGSEGRIYLNEGFLIKVDWFPFDPDLPQYIHIEYDDPIFDDNDIDMIRSLPNKLKDKIDQKIRNILHKNFPYGKVKDWEFYKVEN